MKTKNKKLNYIMICILIIELISCSKLFSSNQTEVKNNMKNNISFNLQTKTVRLNSGYDMPIIGIGTYSLRERLALIPFQRQYKTDTD